MLRDDIEKFQYSGTIEDGYWGIETVVDKFDFRPEARKLIVLLTDEERDNEREDLNFSAILDLLNTNGITLYAIVEEQFQVKYSEYLHLFSFSSNISKLSLIRTPGDLRNMFVLTGVICMHLYRLGELTSYS